jgi:hypothetical protein
VNHEVIDDELASSVKKFRQGFLSIGSVENVRFGDSLPWEIAALAAQFVAKARELFFFREKRDSR